MTSRSTRSGFSLIELMIVVAIIGILSAVAIPNFIRYQLRAKTTEARTNLGGIRTSQTAFLGAFDNYATPAAQPAAVPGILRTAWPNNACPAACKITNTAACTQFSCMGYKPSADVYYQYGGTSRAAAAGVSAEFAVGVVGDLDGDSNRSSFTWQSNAGAGLGVLADGISACAAGRNANQIVECAYGRY